MSREINNTATRTAKKRKRKIRRLTGLIIVLVLCAAFATLCSIPYFHVNGIAVLGNDETTDEEVIELSGIKTGRSVFLVNPLWVKYKVRKNLYIDEVNVKWKLPDKVEITITEKTAKAEFKLNDKYVITDINGIVIEVTGKARKATLVDGITVKNARKRENIHVRETENMQKALRIIEAADEGDIFFKKIQVKDQDVKAYVFDELICKGKYKDVIRCIRSGTLKSVVYDLYQKDREKGIVTVAEDNYCFFTP